MIERDKMSEKEIRDWYVSKHGLESNDDGTKDYFVHKAFLKAWDEKRPHGEWVHAEEYDYLDEDGVEHFHIKCPNCGFLHDCFDCHTAQYNFCPNCGADMRKEGEAE